MIASRRFAGSALVVLSFFVAWTLAGPATTFAVDPARASGDSTWVVQPGGDAQPAGRRERKLAKLLSRASRDRSEADALVVDYPRADSIYPKEMPPPTFLWHDPSELARSWFVEVTFEGSTRVLRALVPGDAPPEGEIDDRCLSITNRIYEPTPYQASARSWKPPADLWAVVRRLALERKATFTFAGLGDGESPQILSRGATHLRISSDPVLGSIFYRDVPLMPSATSEGVIKPLDQRAQPLIAWRLKDVSREDSRVLLSDMPTCANCHSFSADGNTLALDVDGPSGDKGAYAIVGIEPQTTIRDADVMTWNAYADKPRGLNTLGFLSRIRPDGRFVVSTVNEALYVRNFWDFRFSQVFFPTRGILAYYSRESKQIQALPGADDPAFVHCDAVWTPDGETLVFARAAAREPYDRGKPLATYAGDPNETQIRYDLYRMPFDGGRGGTPQSILGASNNGMSNSFPKVSPDGKWVVFVKSANGQLMRPDSRLWIVPLEGGEAREMRCNMPTMNSWHSFSPDGRWMVFSSKGNRPYTQMFLTHIDEQGRDSPPILIEGTTAANRAVNLPEFVNRPYDEFLEITVPAVDHYPLFRKGNELAREGKIDEAIAAFTQALEGGDQAWRVNDWRIHDSLSKTLMLAGRDELAIRHCVESLRLNPYNAEMHGNLGALLLRRGETDVALEHLDAAVTLQPGDAKALFNRATARARAGLVDEARRDFDATLEANPLHAAGFGGRASLRLQSGDLEGALSDLDRSIELQPTNPSSRYLRARAREATGDLDGAIEDLTEGLALAPPDWPGRESLERLLATIRDRRP